MAISWDSNLDFLKSLHNQISDDLKNKKIGYIDIPCHYNTGDLLIYLGTEQFFQDYEINVTYRALQNNINYKKLLECDVILVHGGGNFGDIYLDHQIARENLLLKLKNKDVIFLPQSIYYKNNLNLENSINVFKQHNNVKMYVRDKDSFEIAKLLTENVVLMPDMAHSLHPLIEKSEVVCLDSKNKRILNLVRNDCEGVVFNREIKKRSFDWSDLCSTSDVVIQRIINASRRTPFFSELMLKNWLVQVNYNVNNAISYVEKYDVVHTDRLHGFILAYLLGKNVFLYDNNYKKIEKYKDCWLKECDLITTYSCIK